jgi:hypothetical protein
VADSPLRHGRRGATSIRRNVEDLNLGVLPGQIHKDPCECLRTTLAQDHQIEAPGRVGSRPDGTSIGDVEGAVDGSGANT